MKTAIKVGDEVAARYDLEIDDGARVLEVPAGTRGRVHDDRDGELSVKFAGIRVHAWFDDVTHLERTNVNGRK